MCISIFYYPGKMVSAMSREILRLLITAFAVFLICSYADLGSKNYEENVGRENSERRTKPTLYIITPTYPRWTQLPDMVRLGQTLKVSTSKSYSFGILNPSLSQNLENVLWLVTEDSFQSNGPLLEFLESLGVPYKYKLSKETLDFS